MKKVNVTFSIPPETHQELQKLVGRKKMSAFVAALIDKALEDKKKQLKRAYQEAANDPDIQKTFEQWSATDADLGDWEW
ncbi:MAG: hypothetical protein WD055_00560 [Candidatus Dependentiae bacterium]